MRNDNDREYVVLAVWIHIIYRIDDQIIYKYSSSECNTRRL